MNRQATQQEFLRQAKIKLGLDWDTLAVTAGIAPRALKSYRLPSSSSGCRTMPPLARAAIEDLLTRARAEPAFDQRTFLDDAMRQLQLTRGKLAAELGLSSETVRNYLRPPSTEGHRPLPTLVRAAIQRLLRSSRRPKKGSQKAT